MLPAHSNNKGFTIVELLIVVVVIAILAALSLVAYNGITSRSKEVAAEARLSSLVKEIELYQVQNGQYPVDTTSLQSSGDGDIIIPFDGRYCVSIEQDNHRYSRYSDSNVTTEGICQEQAPSYAVAPEACIGFETGTQSLREYYTHEANNPANPLCPTEFTLPSSVGGIDILAIRSPGFEDNTHARKVVIADGIEIIEATTFMNSAVSYVYIPTSVTEIGTHAFHGTSLTSLNIPSSVDTIACEAFNDMNSLTSLTIGLDASDTTPDLALTCEVAENMTALRSLVLGPHITTVNSAAFYGDSQLASLTILDGTKPLTLTGSSFYGAGLRNVTLPGRTVSLSSGVFAQTTSLQSMTIKEGSGNLELHSAPFPGSSLQRLSLPSNTTGIFWGGLAATALTELTIATGGENPLTITDGALGGSQLTTFTVPSHATALQGGAFNGMTTLTSLVIDSAGNVPLTINQAAFSGTSISSLVVPPRVAEISQNAFAGTLITSVSVPAAMTIDGTAFPAGTTITTY